jgi:hypothetical protein
MVRPGIGLAIYACLLAFGAPFKDAREALELDREGQIAVTQGRAIGRGGGHFAKVCRFFKVSEGIA